MGLNGEEQEYGIDGWDIAYILPNEADRFDHFHHIKPRVLFYYSYNIQV